RRRQAPCGRRQEEFGRQVHEGLTRPFQRSRDRSPAGTGGAFLSAFYPSRCRFKGIAAALPACQKGRERLRRRPETKGFLDMIETVGIIGAGTMGNGIAQISAAAGLPVVMVDISDAAVARGLATVGG